MSTKRKIAIGAGATAASLAGALALILAVNTTLDHSRTDRYTITQPVQKVLVASDAGNVDVVATDTDRVRVRQTTRWVTQEPAPERTVNAGVLRLDDACRDAWVIFKCETDYRIEVPRTTEVEIAADSGDINVTGLAGRITAESDSGQVKGTLLTSGNVTARTDAGDVKLGFAVAPASIDAETDSGSVRIEVPRAEYAIDTDTDSGDTTVSGIVRYDLAEHSIRAHADAGDVTIQGS
jgi:DUF4097 and DUF4098 domain-containing protein YvlB